MWVSRGCPVRCAFCQTGWACRHQAHPYPEAAIRDANAPGRVTLVSNALASVPFAARLPPTHAASHTFASIRGILPQTHTVRLGIEGVSERLRLAVGKPIPCADLVDETVRLMGAGRCVRWFLIAGLPGERGSDWDELRESLRAVAVMGADHGVLQVSFTAWTPEPATPLRGEPLDAAYWDRYQAFADWYFGCIRRNRIALFKCGGPVLQRRTALAQLGCEPGTQTQNARVNYATSDALRDRRLQAYRAALA